MLQDAYGSDGKSTVITRPGISSETLAAAGIKLVDYPEPGSVEIPYRNIDGHLTGFSRYRLPRVRPDGQKYHQEKDSGAHVFFPAAMATAQTLVIVEGEFKSLSLHDAGVATIGLPSFTCYITDPPRLLPGIVEALKRCSPDRVLFVGDSDTATNYSFARSAQFLADTIKPCPVLCPRLKLDGPKGVDDLRESLGAEFPSRWEAMVATAEPVTAGTSAGLLAVRLLKREEDIIRAGHDRERQRQRVIRMIAECSDELSASDLAKLAGDLFSLKAEVITKAVKAEKDRIRDSVREHRTKKDIGDRLNSKRPMVELPCPGRLLSEFANELGTILAKCGVYRRGHAPFRVLPDGKTESLSANHLRTYAEDFLVCYRANRMKGGSVIELVTTMSETDARGVIAAPQFLNHLPDLHRVNDIAMPVLRPGRAVELLAPGYDPQTKTLTLSTCSYRHDMSVEEAVDFLEETMADFPWADDGRSKSVAVAAMFTTYASTLLPPGALRPVFIYIANREGAGKTICAQLATAAGIGSTEIKTGPKDNEECRKVLASEVMAGATAIIFDNCRGHLALSSIEALASAPTFSDRILGKSESFSGPNLLTLLLTGNGLTVSPDLRRRALFVELIMEEEKSEDRVFKRILDEPALLAMRPKLLAALWSLVRHWNALGRPKPSRTHASFPRWAEIIGGIVEAAGFACCLDSVEIESGGNTDGDDMRHLVEAMPDGEKIDFSSIVTLCRDVGAFERLVGEKDTEMERKAKSDLGGILKRFDRTLFAETRRFRVIGKGHQRRFLAQTEGKRDMGDMGSMGLSRSPKPYISHETRVEPMSPMLPMSQNGSESDSEVLDTADDTGWTLRRRLAACEAILGREETTESERSSCLIGLRRHVGTHPAVALMVERLKTKPVLRRKGRQ